jgi:hypothetical protein
MSARGLRLFGDKLRKRPLVAAGGLLLDYLTYLGMVAFWLLLVASGKPLAWLERRSQRPVRATLVAWLARVARG